MDLFTIASSRARSSRRNAPREELERDRRALRERVKKFVKLKPGFYFDPVSRAILRKAGSQYFYVKGDRRTMPRINKENAEEAQFRLIAGGLFWDPKTMAIYKPRGASYILYSKDRRKSTDRRKTKAAAPGGKERRKTSRRK